jgi:cytochrome P450 family 142 subfamily A polypeptide 1
MQAAADAFGAYLDYANTLMAARRAEPCDDLISILVHADRDGELLEYHQLAFEILLLLLGGDETTRNVTCGGMEQLLLHPDQMRALIDAPADIRVAVEEMLRWVSPIKNMSRTLTRDIEFGGEQLRAGDKALMLYEAANLDEAQFDGPEHFDATRTPNDHIAFGFGAHFCLGASLARIELHAIFERLLARLPDLKLAGDVPPPRALTGIIEMPVSFTTHAPC